MARESMRGKELRRDGENKSTYNVGEVSSESGICTSLFCLCKVYKHGLLQHCRETGLKKENQTISPPKNSTIGFDIMDQNS